MTKSLTEQWRNGTLPENWYYTHIKSILGNLDCITINYCDEDGVFEEYPDEDIKEVLAPVLSYDEYNGLLQEMHTLEKLQDFCELLLVGEKQEWERIVKRGNRKEMGKWLNERKNKTVERLEKKLKIAKKALNDILNDGDDYWDQDKAQDALTKMEGVK